MAGGSRNIMLRNHARKLKDVKEGQCVEIKGVSIKPLGDQRQWQCSALDCHAAVTAGTQVRVLEEGADTKDMPQQLPVVLLEALPKYRKANHLISVAGVNYGYLQLSQIFWTQSKEKNLKIYHGIGAR